MADEETNIHSVDYKSEEGLELSWGWWLADPEYQKWRYEQKNDKNNKQPEPEQLELFSHSA